MPLAVVTENISKRFELRMLPGAFVVIKRLNYGQSMRRRAMLKLSVQSNKGNSREFSGELALANVEITRFEFATCIVEHNLENASGALLNFNNPADFELLDPRVGQEIEKYISDMNDISEEDDDLGN